MAKNIDSFITKDDYERGFKRINVKFPLYVAIKITERARTQGLPHAGTFVKMCVYDILHIEQKDSSVMVLPGQQELFQEQSKKKVRKK